jgi:hypothetical protein
MNPYSKVTYLFIDDALVRRRMWTPEGIRPIVTVTRSDQSLVGY